jgi:hypothetical protein
MIVVNKLDIRGVILTNRQMGIEMEFVVRIVLLRLRRNLIESCGVSWNLITIKVGFLSESTSLDNEISESDNKVVLVPI